MDRWLSGIVLSDADVNFRGSAEEWFSEHFRVPGCPCRNGRSFYELKYTGAHPVMRLNTKTASRKYSCCLTGSQRKSFNKGLMWSNFPARSQYDTKVAINCNRFQFLPQKRGESHLPWQSYICLLPSTKSFVFSGWSNSLLLKHQYRIRNMS